MARKFFRFTCIQMMLLCLSMLCSVFPVSKAETVMDPSHNVSLTIHYHSGDTPLPGVVFDIYKVADVSSSIHFTLTDAFRNAPLSLDRLMDQGAWKESADILKNFVQDEAIASTASAVTNDDGEALVTDLNSGLYLVTGASLELNWNVYIPETALILLPNRSMNGAWLYDVSMYPKPEIENIERLSRQVVKLWNDQNNTMLRPNQLSIELLCNDEIYDTVLLNAANGWSYRWQDLDSRYQWSIREPSVPAGYISKITQSGDRFIITNTLSSTVTPAPDSSLPQTGLTWWPVPVLALTGMGLFVIGWLRQRRVH